MRQGQEAEGGIVRPSITTLGRLTGIAMLSCLVAACGPGSETRDPPQDPSREIEPDPQLGAQPADIDIGRRAAEAEGDLDTSASRAEAPVEPADDTGATQLAALGSTQALRAAAEIDPTDGNDARGNASFIETEDGLEIVATLTGLAPGDHGIHLHENGDCSGEAASAAGDHFAPGGAPHGAPTDEESEHHAGDLGNISADESGNAELRLSDTELEIDGERGVVGRAIVVHEGEDDLVSQPSGGSGNAVACGVVELRATG